MEDGAQAQQQDLTAPKLSPEELRVEGERWAKEFAAAKRWLQNWQEQAKEIESVVRDERKAGSANESRWNLFAANRETKAAMLYGRPPRVSVERRFSDESDDVGRVSCEMLDRLLNTDIERRSDGFSTALMHCLLDRLDSGWALPRVRYVAEFEDVAEVPAKYGSHPATGEQLTLAEAVPATKRKTFEDVETDYVHWQDQLWQPCRVHGEMGWWSQRTQMTKEQVEKRWGADVAAAIQYNGKPPVMQENYDPNTAGMDWKRADIWEVWDKDREKVIWYCEGYGAIECIDDPYGLEGFYPFAKPMVANPTTSKYLPRPDYVIAQDLYDELNVLTTRIKALMRKGVRVAGAYDAKHKELENILGESADGELVPVQNWNLSGEGIQNAIWIFPTQEVVQCILQLRDYRRELIDAIAQITGMSDIMRGEATQAGATATEQRVKTRMGSVRMQAMQDDFARCASETQQLRAQLVAKFFEPQTIAQRSNARFMSQKDQQLVPQALELIKSPAFSQFRIEVKSEAISLADFAATKAERFEAVGTLAQVMQMAESVAKVLGPAGMAFALKLGKSTISGMRGVSDMEAAFDEAASIAEQAAQQAQQQSPPPDPKVVAEQMKQQTAQQKGQLDMQKEQLKHQQKLQEIGVEVQADAMREENQRQSNVQEFAQRQQIAAAFRPPKPPPQGAP